MVSNNELHALGEEQEEEEEVDNRPQQLLIDVPKPWCMWKTATESQARQMSYIPGDAYWIALMFWSAVCLIASWFFTQTPGIIGKIFFGFFISFSGIALIILMQMWFIKHKYNTGTYHAPEVNKE